LDHEDEEWLVDYSMTYLTNVPEEKFDEILSD
jgi:hypothetical protein